MLGRRHPQFRPRPLKQLAERLSVAEREVSDERRCIAQIAKRSPGIFLFNLFRRSQFRLFDFVLISLLLLSLPGPQ